MSDREDVPTGDLWSLIEANALLAQKHTKWDLYLTRIKVLVEMIENRIERHQDTNPEKLEHALDKEESQGEPKAGGQKTSSTATIQDELARYTACVFEPTDIVEIRRLPSGKSTWHQAGELAEAAESLAQDNQQKQHIYIGANTRRARGGTKSTDVACAHCLFVGFDGITADDAKYRWNNAGLPTPTITIASGHGVHAYWRLTEPITDMTLWSKLQKKLIALLDSDPAIHDPARIMRLPGFTNHKEPVAACKIIDADRTRIYKLKSLLPLLNIAVTKSDEGPFKQQTILQLRRRSSSITK